MKKTLFTIAAAVMMFAATSCKKESINEPEVLRDPEANEFLASIDGGGMVQNAPRVGDGMNTMATFNPNDKLQVLWQQGDVIYVNGIQFTCNSNPETNNRAYFENESYKTSGYQAPVYHAFYSTSVSPNANAASGTLNAIQYYNPERQAENLPMYAESEDHWLNFSNICAAVKIYVPCTADSIVISNTSAAMNGAFTVSGGKAIMTNETPSDAEKKIRIEKRVDGESAQFHACDSLYIAIPDGGENGYEGFCISFYEGGTCVYTTGEGGTLKVAANKLYRIVGYKYPNHLLPGKFSVSANEQVQFTTGNLKGTANNDPSSFENDQTDYRKAFPENSYFGHFTNCKNEGEYTIENNTYHALSAAEFAYLLKTTNTGSNKYSYKGKYRTDADNLHSFAKVDNVYCLLVAPDGAEAFDTTRHIYTLKEVNSMGLLCLPMAGYHENGDGTQILHASKDATSSQPAEARYWTKQKTESTSASRYNVEIVINITDNETVSDNGNSLSINYRTAGQSTSTCRTIRLVKRP